MTKGNEMSEPSSVIARVIYPDAFEGSLRAYGKPGSAVLARERAIQKSDEILKALAAAGHAVLRQGELEVAGDWLVVRGAHEPEYPAGAPYGAMPYSDAEPVLNLSAIPGWRAMPELDGAMIERFREGWRSADELGLAGKRTAAGLRAALYSDFGDRVALAFADGTPKTNTEIILDAATARGDIVAPAVDGIAHAVAEVLQLGRDDAYKATRIAELVISILKGATR